MSRIDRATSMSRRAGPALARFLDEGLAHRAAIVDGLSALLLEKGIGILVPATVGEIVPEQRRGGRRLPAQAHGKVRLDQALQRFLDMARVLILRRDRPEAVDRGNVFAPLEIVAADLHLLAGELVASDQDLLARVVDIF